MFQYGFGGVFFAFVDMRVSNPECLPVASIFQKMRHAENGHVPAATGGKIGYDPVNDNGISVV